MGSSSLNNRQRRLRNISLVANQCMNCCASVERGLACSIEPRAGFGASLTKADFFNGRQPSLARLRFQPSRSHPVDSVECQLNTWRTYHPIGSISFPPSRCRLILRGRNRRATVPILLRAEGRPSRAPHDRFQTGLKIGVKRIAPVRRLRAHVVDGEATGSAWRFSGSSQRTSCGSERVARRCV